MIILTVLTVFCFLAVTFEIFSLYRLFATSIPVNCCVISSEKKEIREDGCLVKAFWLTSVTFDCNGSKMNDALQTSTFCPNGQSIKCYYSPVRKKLFRKRDFKNYIRSSSPVFLSVGILLLMLNFILSSFNIDSISKINIAKFLTGLLIAAFALLGIGRILTFVMAVRNSSKKRIEYITCSIHDVVKKTAKHKENKSCTYYPIYKYTYRGEEHIVQSKIGRSQPPKKNSITTIPISIKKGGPVEYKDTAKSLILGIVFLIMSILITIIVTIL